MYKRQLLNRPVLYALAVPDQEPEFRVTPAEEAGMLASLTLEEKGVANWVIRNNKRAGAGTDTLDVYKRQVRIYFFVINFYPEIVKTGREW